MSVALNEDYKPDWQFLQRHHEAMFKSTDQKRRELIKLGFVGNDAYKKLNAEASYHHSETLKILDTYQHQTVLDFARWLFRNFPPLVDPKYVQDFKSFQTMEAVKQHKQDLLNIQEHQDPAKSKKWSDALIKNPELYSKLYLWDLTLLSFTSNARNKKLIDVSELARVYENVEFEDEKPQNKASQTVEKRTETLKPLSKQDISAQVLQERLKATEKSLEVLNEERERERQNYENRLETLEIALTKAQDGYNSVTKLLEDHRTKESGAGDSYLTFLSLPFIFL